MEDLSRMKRLQISTHCGWKCVIYGDLGDWARVYIYTHTHTPPWGVWGWYCVGTATRRMRDWVAIGDVAVEFFSFKKEILYFHLFSWNSGSTWQYKWCISASLHGQRDRMIMAS